ncbi:MAG: hypothetical protein ABI787_10880 [Spartobacteria bacterium]
MKIKIALSLILAALLPACTTTTSVSTSQDKSTRYANNSVGDEPAPPAEGPEADIPSEGPANLSANSAYVPTPLLRSSAATSP